MWLEMDTRAREWIASRLTSLQTKRSELEVQLQARTTTASNAKEALQRHREAVDAVKGEVAEEWRQTELAGKQLAEEGAARQRAAERLAVLRREKASLCKQLEAAKWNLATASAEVVACSEHVAAKEASVTGLKQQCRAKEQSLQKLKAVKEEFFKKAAEEKRRRQELREKMRAWLAEQDAVEKALQTKVGQHPQEIGSLREKQEAARRKGIEAKVAAAAERQRAEESRSVIPLYKKQREEILEEIRDVIIQDDLAKQELEKVQGTLLAKQHKDLTLNFTSSGVRLGGS